MTTTMNSIRDHLLIRDESPECIKYCQPLAPTMTLGDYWHCTTSHRTYRCVEGTQDPGFTNVVEVTTLGDCDTFDCKTLHLEGRGVAAPPPEECNGLCMTGNDIGVPSNEIAYPHPECPKHSCNRQCSPSIQVYHVDCPAHGRKPSQT